MDFFLFSPSAIVRVSVFSVGPETVLLPKGWTPLLYEVGETLHPDSSRVGAPLAVFFSISWVIFYVLASSGIPVNLTCTQLGTLGVWHLS